MLFIHYHVLSRYFLLTRVYLKSNHIPCYGVTSLLKFGGWKVMLSLIPSRQQPRRLEGFYCWHLVQLLQGESPCTYRTTMFHQSKPWACNIETHWYIVWNSKKDNETSRNPLLLDLFLVALAVFPFPQPYQEEIVALVVVDVFNSLLLCQPCFVVRGGVSFNAFDVCYQYSHWSWWIIFNQAVNAFTDEQMTFL